MLSRSTSAGVTLAAELPVSSVATARIRINLQRFTEEAMIVCGGDSRNGRLDW